MLDLRSCGHPVCSTRSLMVMVRNTTKFVVEVSALRCPRQKVDLPGKCGEHQLRNQEVFYGKREQTDAGVSA